MRCAIYVRVSREEQLEGWSLDAQLEQCMPGAGCVTEVAGCPRLRGAEPLGEDRIGFQSHSEAALPLDDSCV